MLRIVKSRADIYHLHNTASYIFPKSLMLRKGLNQAHFFISNIIVKPTIPLFIDVMF